MKTTLITAITNFELSFQKLNADSCYDQFTSTYARALVEHFNMKLPLTGFTVDYKTDFADTTFSFSPFYVEDLDGKMNFRVDVFLDGRSPTNCVKRFEVLPGKSGGWDLTSMEYDLDEDTESKFTEESNSETFSSAIMHLVQLLENEDTDYTKFVNAL